MSNRPSDGLGGTVVVTGGGAGIGRAAVIASARRGASVAVLDIDEGAAQSAAAEARELGAPGSLAAICNVADEASVAAAIEAAADELGRPSGLVACAGIDRGGLVHELDLNRWLSVINTNLTGTFLSCKHVLARMVDAGAGGSIVCASSPWGQVSAPGGASAYSASKGGISALVRSLALDYAPHGIRVNAIVPGATDTGLMWGDLPKGEIATARSRIGAQIALGRLAEPSEIAGGIVWLLGGDSGYVTGSELVVDGGLLARASIES